MIYFTDIRPDTRKMKTCNLLIILLYPYMTIRMIQVIMGNSIFDNKLKHTELTDGI